MLPVFYQLTSKQTVIWGKSSKGLFKPQCSSAEPRLASTTGRNSLHLSSHAQQPTIASVYINQKSINILTEIKQVFTVDLV